MTGILGGGGILSEFFLFQNTSDPLCSIFLAPYFHVESVIDFIMWSCCTYEVARTGRSINTRPQGLTRPGVLGGGKTLPQFFALGSKQHLFSIKWGNVCSSSGVDIQMEAR